ncbi:MAG: winged helix-turn-helix transcriptional regulator [Saprospiraceae bacterium]|nr:winged helix-turn-helix transcriptional regulator [Saprospiraceae bacterium]
MKNRLFKIALPLLVLFATGLAIQGMSTKQPESEEAKQQFSQKVNLAMRQAADRLLDQAGDSTHTIPPVMEKMSGEFELHLENDLNYEELPRFLEAALAQFGIKDPYYVSIYGCLDNLLMLGYAKESLKNGQPACSGRARAGNCYNLSVTFPYRAKNTPNNGHLWWATGLLALAALLSLFIYKKQKNKDLEVVAPQKQELENPNLLRFGQTEFDPTNLSILVADERQSLTFREAKLLQFFAERPNQVLERDVILAAVWEDEGIIVGRSLDVFVSRLRKILQKDTALKIANVHGVGYRLEVA